jgi:hypothetical protein
MEDEKKNEAEWLLPMVAGDPGLFPTLLASALKTTRVH